MRSGESEACSSTFNRTTCGNNAGRQVRRGQRGRGGRARAHLHEEVEHLARAGGPARLARTGREQRVSCRRRRDFARLLLHRLARLPLLLLLQPPRELRSNPGLLLLLREPPGLRPFSGLRLGSSRLLALYALLLRRFLLLLGLRLRYPLHTPPLCIPGRLGSNLALLRGRLPAPPASPLTTRPARRLHAPEEARRRPKKARDGERLPPTETARRR